MSRNSDLSKNPLSTIHSTFTSRRFIAGPSNPWKPLNISVSRRMESQEGKNASQSFQPQFSHPFRSSRAILTQPSIFSGLNSPQKTKNIDFMGRRPSFNLQYQPSIYKPVSFGDRKTNNQRARQTNTNLKPQNFSQSPANLPVETVPRTPVSLSSSNFLPRASFQPFQKEPDRIPPKTINDSFQQPNPAEKAGSVLTGTDTKMMGPMGQTQRQKEEKEYSVADSTDRQDSHFRHSLLYVDSVQNCPTEDLSSLDGPQKQQYYEQLPTLELEKLKEHLEAQLAKTLSKNSHINTLNNKLVAILKTMSTNTPTLVESPSSKPRSVLTRDTQPCLKKKLSLSKLLSSLRPPSRLASGSCSHIRGENKRMG